MRTPAQVLPAGLAALGVQVVVDGQRAAADLDRLLVRRRGPALKPDQLKFVGLGREFGSRLVVGHDPAAEALTLLYDLPHFKFKIFKIFGGESFLNVEVVIEAILDRRADAEFRLGMQVLHRLREHVRGRMPQDREPGRRLDADRLDPVAVGQAVREIPRGAVDLGRDNFAVDAASPATASPAVVPASTTCSRPARVI